MFEGIEPKRILQMNNQERRWYENIKKAFYESDKKYMAGQPENYCLPELFKAVDTAKTLRRSLRGEDISNKNNKKRFVEFIELEIPSADKGGLNIQILNKRTGKEESFSFAELYYAIRCMVHENENLNAQEDVDYHILVDWSKKGNAAFYVYGKEKIICDGFLLLERLREIISKFITGLDAIANISQGKSFTITCRPNICSIKPERKTKK